jgi:diadenosine tetraphosphate (Ap4A) HIT family hydrolase
MSNGKGAKCCLCSQIQGDAANDLISKLLPEAPYCRRIAIESDHFAVVPSLGPLVPGHSLLCPKQHVKSFADLDQRLTGEYRDFKAFVSERVGTVFDAPVHCFEHGSASGGSRIICTVDHAHLHLVPANVEVRSMLASDRRWIATSGDPLELRVGTDGDEYLYYEDPHGSALVACAAGQPFDSQHLRKLFAEALGRTEKWNWRDAPLPEEADRAFRALVIR